MRELRRKNIAFDTLEVNKLMWNLKSRFGSIETPRNLIAGVEELFVIRSIGSDDTFGSRLNTLLLHI